MVTLGTRLSDPVLAIESASHSAAALSSFDVSPGESGIPF
jgi:hypothetical protein